MYDIIGRVLITRPSMLRLRTLIGSQVVIDVLWSSGRVVIAHIITFIRCLPTYNHIQLCFCLGLTIDSEIDIILVQILRGSSIDLMLAFLTLSAADPRAHTWNSTALLILGMKAFSRARLNYLRLSLL